jgi:hypothetical protein
MKVMSHTQLPPWDRNDCGPDGQDQSRKEQTKTNKDRAEKNSPSQPFAQGGPPHLAANLTERLARTKSLLVEAFNFGALNFSEAERIASRMRCRYLHAWWGS